MSSLANTNDVFDYMEDHMVTYNFRGQPQRFLPDAALDKVTGRAVIQRIIAQDQTLVQNIIEQSQFVDDVYQKGRRLFAICVYCDQALSYLKAMLENDLTDVSLPLKDNDFGSLNQHRKFVRSFTANQKHFNTIYLSEGSILKLDDRLSDRFSIPIDYEEKPASFKGRGAFGEVWEVKIHSDQHPFLRGANEDSQFAMKVTQHEGREQNYHRAMAGLNHSHLVKCLASFTLGAKYQMIYELASCDLEDFIQKHPCATPRSGLTSSWLAQQLAGLAGALQVVHNPDGSTSSNDASSLGVPKTNSAKSGYIHDIKPENILVFIYRGNVCWLRLSDFSCAKVVDFVATISGKRDSYKTGTKSGTPIYRAPESQDGATSRPYDMWSLGCVYLELLVWYVEGYQALVSFRNDREAQVRPGGIFDEGFYSEVSPGNVQLREPVVKKIGELSNSCKGELKEIVDVIPSLLRIKPKERLSASQLASKLRHFGTGADPGVVARRTRAFSGSMFTSNNVPTDESDSEFGDMVKVTGPSGG